MQFPALVHIAIKSRQVRHREQFIVTKQQRQSATHEARHRALIEQALEITVTSITQMHDFTALTIGNAQRPDGSLPAERDMSVIGQA